MKSATIGALREGLTNPVVLYSGLLETEQKGSVGRLRLAEYKNSEYSNVEAPFIVSMVDSTAGEDETPFLEFIRDKGYQLSIFPNGIVTSASQFDDNNLETDIKLAVYGIYKDNVTYFECTDAQLLGAESDIFPKVQEG